MSKSVRKKIDGCTAGRGETARAKATLERCLGPFQLTALGVGAVIGAGIFVMADWARTMPGRH